MSETYTFRKYLQQTYFIRKRRGSYSNFESYHTKNTETLCARKTW